MAPARPKAPDATCALCDYERGKRPHARDCPNRPVIVMEDGRRVRKLLRDVYPTCTERRPDKALVRHVYEALAPLHTALLVKLWKEPAPLSRQGAKALLAHGAIRETGKFTKASNGRRVPIYGPTRLGAEVAFKATRPSRRREPIVYRLAPSHSGADPEKGEAAIREVLRSYLPPNFPPKPKP